MTTLLQQADRFARVQGSPGEQPRLRGLLRVLLPVLGVAAGAGLLLGALLPVPRVSLTLAGLGLIGLAGLLAVTLRFSQRQLADFIKGARGEEGVARILGLLPAAYDVFHGLAITPERGTPTGDLDHVIVGPNGVFLVETKNWAGPITVSDGRILYDGREPDRAPLEQVNRAADALRALLRSACQGAVPVQPIVCFSAGETPAKPLGASGALVCRDRHLLGVIEEHADTRIKPALQARIVACLSAQVV